jgi:hypothetical protein
MNKLGKLHVRLGLKFPIIVWNKISNIEINVFFLLDIFA